MDLHLKVWRQKNRDAEGRFVNYETTDVSPDMSFLEMIDVVKSKADEQGRFTSESVWKSWSDWEFGQKKNPSPLLTLKVYRVLKRITDSK